MQQDTILVLDYGSQYNQLIVRRIRELGVYSVLYPHSVSLKQIQALENVRGIILSGGPHSVYQENAFTIDPRIIQSGIPILGICYGMQLICFSQNGEIKKTESREYGKTVIRVSDHQSLFQAIPSVLSVYMSHGDQIVKLPEGFKVMASSQTCPFAAIGDQNRKIYGVQFHPEVQHTEHGMDILNNFLRVVCEIIPSWSMENYISAQTEAIKMEVGDKRVLCGISGGVDSAVAALLIHKAIGDQLSCVFVDHGLLRKHEANQVMDTFQNKFNIQVRLVNAKDRFLDKLAGVTDPEQKRKIIGNEFIRVFEEEAIKMGIFDYLAQGTLYTDIIESGTSTASRIKSHHNVGGLPKDMNLKLLEPLKQLFKDEVRVLGKELGLSDDIVKRQPFPGPGLAIRILGDVTEEKLQMVRESDAILREEIAKAKLDEKIWQYFTVLTNVKSVGVMGDERTYDSTIAIRAITSIDGMTADWAKIPWEVLDLISRRIVNEIKGVNRIVYDITSKPPATIEWE
ncbi:MAG TPA: GMP synthase (glutamine-hydrolyzing) [Acholeplasmatales bacterium]|nr:GMP synthase (glutamine-hydrolyzing) [Acholeplasmatales bacterium]